MPQEHISRRVSKSYAHSVSKQAGCAMTPWLNNEHIKNAASSAMNATRREAVVHEHTGHSFDLVGLAPVTKIQLTSKKRSTDCSMGVEQRSQAQVKNFSRSRACWRTFLGSYRLV